LIKANINIHKLDAAFDIDPLFHKMSKTFDEGGAKGLLLANLGVSYQGDAGGCKIVFDSTLDEDVTCNTDKEPAQGRVVDEPAVIDVSSLNTKLDSILMEANQSIHDMPLVPQLASLRCEYADLEQGGFVEQQTKAVSAYDICWSCHLEVFL
jgi:condensin complex subunit 2